MIIIIHTQLNYYYYYSTIYFYYIYIYIIYIYSSILYAYSNIQQKNYIIFNYSRILYSLYHISILFSNRVINILASHNLLFLPLLNYTHFILHSHLNISTHIHHLIYNSILHLFLFIHILHICKLSLNNPEFFKMIHIFFTSFDDDFDID
jgi:hypothetical protein